MKTLRLNRAESTAYANGERRFWRACKQQPEVYKEDGSDASWRDKKCDLWRNLRQYTRDCCPYGKTGDRIIVNFGPVVFENLPITAITVEQRGFTKRWGWVVEVGA